MKHLGTKVSIVVLVLTLFSFMATCQEHKEMSAEVIWVDDTGEHREHPAPGEHMMGQGPGPHIIEKMLDKIAEEDPQAAERLRELHETDPDAFRAEMHDYMMNRMKKAEPPEKRTGRRARDRDRRIMGGGRNTMGRRMQEMREKHDEYIEWLEENYPDDANELSKIKEENPRLYMRKLMHSFRDHQKIMRAEKDDPELAAVMKENEELKQTRNEILEKLRTANEQQQEKLKTELKEIVGERFDVIVKRKQLQHDKLLERLERLKEDIKKSEAEVDKWKASKDEKVNDRLEELLKETEKFHWD